MNLAGMMIGHMVGDYLLQNDWMALNKTKASWPCIVHCLLWTLAVLAFGGFNLDNPIQFWWLPCYWWPWPFLAGQFWPWMAAWLFGTHFLLDRFRLAPKLMSHTGQASFRDNLGPWSFIIVDNTWHLVTIWVAAQYY